MSYNFQSRKQILTLRGVYWIKYWRFHQRSFVEINICNTWRQWWTLCACWPAGTELPIGLREEGGTMLMLLLEKIGKQRRNKLSIVPIKLSPRFENSKEPVADGTRRNFCIRNPILWSSRILGRGSLVHLQVLNVLSSTVSPTTKITRGRSLSRHWWETLRQWQG